MTEQIYLPLEIVFEILDFIPRDKNSASSVPTEDYIDTVRDFEVWCRRYEKDYSSDEPIFFAGLLTTHYAIQGKGSCGIIGGG